MTSITVPEYDTRNAPISGIEELRAHLQQLQDEPSTAINVRLLDDVELQLTDDNTSPLLVALLPPLTSILRTTTKDPTPFLTLTIKLLSPLSFTQSLEFADVPSLLTLLSSPLPGANLLALATLQKAAQAPSDASYLSALPEVVRALVGCWLTSQDVGVGERAARVIGDLLETDCDTLDNGISNSDSQARVNGNGHVGSRIPGHARLWHLILKSRANLSIIHHLCTNESADADSPRSNRDVTISQGRLLRLLPRLCTLHIDVLNSPAIPGLLGMTEAAKSEIGEGLLQWAATQMVDRSDVLMHLTLTDFFEALISIMRVSRRPASADHFMKKLVKYAVNDDAELFQALRDLPDRTIGEEAEALRAYIAELLD